MKMEVMGALKMIFWLFWGMILMSLVGLVYSSSEGEDGGTTSLWISQQTCNTIENFISRPCSDFENHGCMCRYDPLEHNYYVDVLELCCYNYKYCRHVGSDMLRLRYTLTDWSYSIQNGECTDEIGTYELSVCICDVEFGKCLQEYESQYIDNLQCPVPV